MSARALLHDQRGTSIIEFALVLPVMLVMMMGLGELAYQEYVQSVLTGAVQRAARDEGIEANASASDAIDTRVETMVRSVVSNPQFNDRSTRRVNYDNYTQASGEPFTDTKYPANNSGTYDGICNHGETYVDLNGNGHYDLNLGSSGQGGASDLVNYTVAVTYKRLFPIRFFRWGSYVTLTSSTMLRNQPYAVQSINNGTTKGLCS